MYIVELAISIIYNKYLLSYIGMLVFIRVEVLPCELFAVKSVM